MEAFRSIARRRLRSALTVLGIAIGVFALVMMGGMAENTNIIMANIIRQLETNIAVFPDGAGGASRRGSVFPLSVAAKLEEVEGVRAVMHGIVLPFDEQAPVVGYGMPAQIIGTNINQQIEADKYINPHVRLSFYRGDWWEEGSRGIAVMGINLATQQNVSVGDIITNRGKQFAVVGIFNRVMGGPDNAMLIPLEDARELLVKTQPLLEFIEYKDFVTTITAVAHKEEAHTVASRIMEELPHLQAVSPERGIRNVEQSMVMFSLIVLASAMIALVVGGLSVINTMLMSVTERIREIGLKKAIGFRDADILREYLLESSLMGFFAGCIGLGLGSLCIYGVNIIATAETGSTVFTLTTRLALGSLVFAVFIAMLAGLYPAYRAAKIDPILALKSE